MALARIKLEVSNANARPASSDRDARVTSMSAYPTRAPPQELKTAFSWLTITTATASQGTWADTVKLKSTFAQTRRVKTVVSALLFKEDTSVSAVKGSMAKIVNTQDTLAIRTLAKMEGIVVLPRSGTTSVIARQDFQESTAKLIL
jgi:hypothetical protein